MSIEIEVQTAKAVQNIKNVDTALDALQRNVGNLGKSGASLGQLQRDFDNLARGPDVAVQALVKAGKTYTSELSKLKIAQTRYNKEMTALMAAGDRPERVKAVQAHLDALSLAVNGQLQKIGGVSTGIKQILMANTQDVKVAADQTVAAVGRVTKALDDMKGARRQVSEASAYPSGTFSAYNAKAALSSPRADILTSVNNLLINQTKLLEGVKRTQYESWWAKAVKPAGSTLDHINGSLINQTKLLEGVKRTQYESWWAKAAKPSVTTLQQINSLLVKQTTLLEGVKRTQYENMYAGLLNKRDGVLKDPTRTAVPTLAKPKEIDDVSKSLQRLTISGNDAHSMARGLASGFNLLWLTWGNLVPLFAGAAVSFGVAKTFAIGMEVEYNIKMLEILGDKTVEQGAVIREELRKIDQTTLFSLTELSKTMVNLEQAGISGAEGLKLTKVSADLAAVGMTNLDVTSKLLAQSMALFPETAGDIEKSAAQMFKVTKDGLLNIEDIGESFKYASTTGILYGQSIEDTLVALKALAQAGIKGTSAGTAWTNFMQDINGRSKPAIAALRELEKRSGKTISAFDATTGRARPMLDVMKDINDAAALFKPDQALKLLNELYTERGIKVMAAGVRDGIEGLQKYRTELESIDSNTLPNASKRIMDTTKGALDQLKGTMVGLLDRIFESMGPRFKESIQSITAQIDSPEFMNIMRGMVGAVTALAAVVIDFLPWIAKLGAAFIAFKAVGFAQSALVGLGSAVLPLIGFFAQGAQAIGFMAGKSVAASASFATMGTSMLMAGAGARAAAAGLDSTGVSAAQSAVKLQAATGVTRLLAITMGFLANPIVGIITTLGILGATWWFTSRESQSASDALTDKVVKDGKINIKALDDEIAKIKERNAVRMLGTEVPTTEVDAALSKARVDATDAFKALSTERRLPAPRPLVLSRLEAANRTASETVAALQRGQEDILSDQARLQREKDAKNAARIEAERKKSEDALKALLNRDRDPNTSVPAGGAGSSSFQSIERFTSKIKAEHDTQLQDLREHYKGVQQIRDDEYAAGIISEGQYQAQRASLMATSYAASSQKLQDNYDKELSELDAYEKEHQSKYKEGSRARAEFDREVFRERKTINEKFNKDKLKAEDEAAKAERAIWSKHHKELLAIRTSTQDAILASQGRILEAQENSDFADRTAGLTGADKAAAEARFSVERALGAEVRKINAEIANERRIQEDLLAAQTLETNEAAYAAQQTRLDESRIRQEELEKGRLARETQAEIEAKAMVGKAYGDAMRAEHEKLKADLSDALMTALTEGGKAGSAKLRSIIEAKLREPVILIVNAIVDTFMGSVFGGGGGAAGGGGGLGGIMNSFNSLQSLYSNLSSGFAGIGASIGSIGASFQYGTAAFSQQSTMLAAQELGMGTVTGTLGSAASMLGGAAAGFVVGKMISGGYSAIGKSGNTAVVAGTAIGALLGGPLGAAIGGAVGGLVNRLFGRKLKDSGIEGTFSGADKFSGNSYEFYKGGVFRSDKTKRSALDSEVTDALGTAFKAVRDGVIGMAETLGLGAEALDGYTRSIKISTKGMNEKQVQEAWAKEFENMSEEMAQRFMGTFETTTSRGLLPLIQRLGQGGDSVAGGLLRALSRGRTTWTPGEFVREGETALQALTRLATSLQAVNATFDTLNYTLYSTSLAGGDMASQLVDLFGGIEGMVGATGAYYQAFYSDAERAATATRQLGTVMSALGVTMPTSRDAFRDLVESQDLTTDAGRKMFAELIKLAPAFADVTSAMQDMSNSLVEEVRRLRGEIYGSSAASLEAQFALTTAAARAGDTNAMALLPSITQALEETAALNAVTAADLTIARARLAASLTETLATQGITVPGLTTSGKPGTGLPSTLDPNRVYHQGSELPAFANGGMYGGGLALVGERGPELINFRRGGQVHTAQQTRALMGQAGDDNPVVNVTRMLLAELTNLRGEVTMLRAETRATAVNTSKSTRLLERVTRDGESLQVTSVDPA